MRRTINNVISTAYTGIRIVFWKISHGNRFHSGIIERFSPNVVCEFNPGSIVKFGHKVRIHSGSKIKVRSNGKLFIGNDVRINYNCMIFCHDTITIGGGTEFGPNVLVYDHDHDYRSGLQNNKFLTSPVLIGRDCWIGAGTIILRGTEIGDHCIIGAGSIVNGKIESHTVFVQKRDSTKYRYEQEGGSSFVS